jgi:hypothetical protein
MAAEGILTEPNEEADVVIELIGDKISMKIASLENFRKANTKVIFDARGIAIGTMATPQQTHPHLYGLIAITSGLGLLLLVIGLSVLFPEPTRFQMRVWLAVMSLAAGAFSMSMTGVANVKAGIGTQIVVGATGAFAMALIYYLVNPAVL